MIFLSKKILVDAYTMADAYFEKEIVRVHRNLIEIGNVFLRVLVFFLNNYFVIKIQRKTTTNDLLSRRSLHELSDRAMGRRSFDMVQFEIKKILVSCVCVVCTATE